MYVISKPWEILETLKDETHRQVQINKKEEGWASWKTEEELIREKELEEEEEYQRILRGEESKKVEGEDDQAENTGANFARGGAETVKAWESDEEEEEEERNCKINCR